MKKTIRERMRSGPKVSSPAIIPRIFPRDHKFSNYTPRDATQLLARKKPLDIRSNGEPDCLPADATLKKITGLEFRGSGD